MIQVVVVVVGASVLQEDVQGDGVDDLIVVENALRPIEIVGIGNAVELIDQEIEIVPGAAFVGLFLPDGGHIIPDAQASAVGGGLVEVAAGVQAAGFEEILVHVLRVDVKPR